VRVGVIGTGKIGAFHAQGLAQMKEVDELSIADLDQRRAADVAQRLGAQLVDTPEQLMQSGVDAVVIAAATPAHAPLLHMALEAGVPAFCEKPIALDLPATDAVIEHVTRSGVLVQIGFQRRFDDGYRAAREAVRSGALGRVQIVRVATHDPQPPSLDYVAGSGGIWLDQTIHDFDIAPWVVGAPVLNVYGEGQANLPGFAERQDVDAACAILRFEGGALGILSGSRVDPRGYDVRMEIFGTRDSIAVGLDGRTPLRSVEPDAAEPRAKAYQNFIERFEGAYRAELRAFVEAVENGSPSLCTVQDARSALVVALAADRSRREHRSVQIAEIG
jgi:myo-inositol 2-dehydrogenase/D-chiro-inositol 1-dehydrogenase